GRFEFDAVPNGKYEFEVLAPGFSRFTKPIVSVAGSIQTAKQNQRMYLTARMEIAPTGSPVVMAATEIAPPGSCGHPESVTYGPRKRSDDTLAGIVINRYPKMPIAGATLQLLDASGAQIAQQQTNERGEFQFKQIAPGRY